MILQDLDKITEELNSKIEKGGEKRSIIWLSGHSICSHNKCFHCSLNNQEFKKDLKLIVKNTDSYKKFEEDFKRIDFSKKPDLCLYLLGSFYNDEELGPDLRKNILKAIGKEMKIKRVIVESRPEFIEYHKIRETREILNDKIVETGVGLDHLNEEYRNNLLNKNIKLSDYEKAVEILGEMNVNIITYVAVGCPGLNEKEAINSAIETGRYAIKRKSIISLEPLQIQKGTLQEKLYSENKFSPPSLWSIIEILKNIYKPGNEIRIGGLVQAPLPYTVFHNCSSCDRKIMKALQKFNQTQSLKELLEFDFCPCRNEWQKRVNGEEIEKTPLCETEMSFK